MAQVDAELECSDPETDTAKLGILKVSGRMANESLVLITEFPGTWSASQCAERFFAA